MDYQELKLSDCHPASHLQVHKFKQMLSENFIKENEFTHPKYVEILWECFTPGLSFEVMKLMVRNINKSNEYASNAFKMLNEQEKGLNNKIKEANNEISNLQAKIFEKDQMISTKDREIEEKGNEIENMQNDFALKIQSLKDDNRSKTKETIIEKNKVIDDLKEKVKLLNNNIKLKEETITKFIIYKEDHFKYKKQLEGFEVKCSKEKYRRIDFGKNLNKIIDKIFKKIGISNKDTCSDLGDDPERKIYETFQSKLVLLYRKVAINSKVRIL